MPAGRLSVQDLPQGDGACDRVDVEDLLLVAAAVDGVPGGKQSALVSER